MTVSLNSPSERHNYRPQRSCGKVMSPVCQSFFSQGVLCPSMHHRSHDWGVSVQGGLCLGCLCQGGGVSRGFSVQGGVSVRGVSVGCSLARRGLCWGSLSGRVSAREISPTVTSRRYPSHWNAFLFMDVFVVKTNMQVWRS